jgi:hypothetical protein
MMSSNLKLVDGAAQGAACDSASPTHTSPTGFTESDWSMLMLQSAL